MTTNDGLSNAQAEKEAREALVGRQGGSRTNAAEEALKRYLASEAFREQRREELTRTVAEDEAGQ